MGEAGECKKSDVLREAKALIAEPWRWCTMMSAVDADGGLVDPRSEDAIRWCAIGAIARVAGICVEHASNRFPQIHSAAAVVAPDCGTNASILNDRGNHADVMAMFDSAIALAEAAGQ